MIAEQSLNRNAKAMNNEMPDEIYIQLGENRIGTEICLRKWSYKPFEDGTKYIRADKVVPDGWKLVPIKPTEEMVKESYHAKASGRLIHEKADYLIEVYKAMLSAAPQPPTKGDE